MPRFRLVITLILFFCATASAQASRSATSYFNRANERYEKGDLDGAIADFDVAITFDPRLARVALSTTPRRMISDFQLRRSAEVYQ